MKDSTVKSAGLILTLAAFCAAVFFLFSDVISYWTGYGTSHITKLDVGNLTFVRDDRLKVWGGGVTYKEVKFYKTPEGEEVAIYQTDAHNQHQVFVRSFQDIYNDNRYKLITTYEPFIVWTYLLVRLTTLFVLSLMILALGGLVMKLMGVGPYKTPLPGKES